MLLKESLIPDTAHQKSISLCLTPYDVYMALKDLRIILSDYFVNISTFLKNSTSEVPLAATPCTSLFYNSN